MELEHKQEEIADAALWLDGLRESVERWGVARPIAGCMVDDANYCERLQKVYVRYLKCAVDTLKTHVPASVLAEWERIKRG